MDRQTYRKIDRQTDRKKYIDRETDKYRQIDRWLVSCKEIKEMDYRNGELNNLFKFAFLAQFLGKGGGRRAFRIGWVEKTGEGVVEGGMFHLNWSNEFNQF